MLQIELKNYFNKNMHKMEIQSSLWSMLSLQMVLPDLQVEHAWAADFFQGGGGKFVDPILYGQFFSKKKIKFFYQNI
jgi:hypothetical protein